jgi:tetratricopeptide (TPR) repeat protein
MAEKKNAPGRRDHLLHNRGEYTLERRAESERRDSGQHNFFQRFRRIVSGRTSDQRIFQAADHDADTIGITGRRGRLFRRGRDQWQRLSALTFSILLCASCAPRAQDYGALYQSAVTYYRNAELDRAFGVLRTGANSNNRHWTERFRLLEAQCLLATNDIDAAWRILSAPELRESPSAETIARRRMLEGNAFLKRAQYTEAHQAFQEAFALASESGMAETRIETQLNRALTFSAQRDLDRGEQFIRDALAIAAKHDDRFHEAAALLNLGLFAAKRGRFDESALLFERVLALCEQRRDAGIVKVPALGNLSLCYSRLGDFDRALDIGKQAIELMRKAGLRSYLTQTVGEMGHIHVLANRLQDAIPWYRQAYELASSANVKTQMALWQSSLAQALAIFEASNRTQRLCGTGVGLDYERANSSRPRT